MRFTCGKVSMVLLVVVAVVIGLPVSAAAAVPNPQPDPGTLWAPAPGEVPAGGTYVYLESDSGDYIGQGRDELYTLADASLDISHEQGDVRVAIDADVWWDGDFVAPTTVNPVAPGYYAGLTRAPFHDLAVGGLSWSGDGRGCNTLTGWFVVDSVTFTAGVLEHLQLRFEQHCEGGGPALRGLVSYDASDTTTPPGPVDPPPEDLWSPAPGATPASGTYVYVQGAPGDWVSGGASYLYTKADATITASATDRHVGIGVDGDEWWSFDFEGMSSISSLQPGYYGDLLRYPFHNPTKGGLSWDGEGRGCNELTGWFVVDELVLDAGVVDQLRIRFEQRCDGGPPAHGEIVIDASDPTTPPGPSEPPPPDLWRPDPAQLPVSGSYIWLDSDPGDYIGGGTDELYRPADHGISASLGTNHLSVAVAGTDWWNGTFAGMSSIPRLEPGYYGDLQRHPFHNPSKGGLSWSGNGRGCNELTGWFAIDELVRSGSTLLSVTLRFEQHCEGGGPALHGLVHWEQGGGSGPLCGEVYVDVAATNPFCGEIGWASAHDIVSGYPDDTFRPGSPASRRAVVAMLYRLAGSPAGPFPEEQFSDVSPGDPFITAIEWAVDAGIVAGYPDGTFRGGTSVSRQALVALMHRLSGAPQGPFSDPLFVDVAGDSPFKTAINWAVDAGVVEGYPDDTFRPRAPVSRQTLAAFLYRFDGLETSST